MALEPDVKVTRQTEDGRYELDGARVSYIRVEFYVGKHGPFVERFPKDTYSMIVRDNKLNDFAREVRT
jgi:hypothetical protein